MRKYCVLLTKCCNDNNPLLYGAITHSLFELLMYQFLSGEIVMTWLGIFLANVHTGSSVL